MSTATSFEASPQRWARIGGALYLAIIVLGLFEELLVRDRLIASGDAAATATNIRMMEPLWRLGIAAEFLLLICAVVLTLIFFLLLRPVSRELAMLAVLFNVVSIAIEAACDLNLVSTLFPLGSAEYLRTFSPEQLNGMAYLAIRSFENGFGLALIFFGCECLVLGHLIVHSGYLPKAVGVLMQIAGACYLINSFALLLSPSLANRLFPAILAPAFVGELSFCLWLLAKGVNVQQWRLRTGRMEQTTVLQIA